MRLAHKSIDGALEGFLQTQYYSCKTSIYWPAVYQAMEFGEADKDLLAHHQKFIHSSIPLFCDCYEDILRWSRTCLRPNSISIPQQRWEVEDMAKEIISHKQE